MNIFYLIVQKAKDLKKNACKNNIFITKKIPKYSVELKYYKVDWIF